MLNPKDIKDDTIVGIPSMLTSGITLNDEEQNYTKEDMKKTILEPYSIFSKRKKLMIVLICSISCFFSPFSTNIYFPALEIIKSDLQTTEAFVTLTVTMYMIVQGIAPSFWASIADTYGRRPVYVSTFLIFIFACIGLGCTNNYATLLSLRMLQAFGSSSALAVGAGTIGDISTPAERGGYMGLFSIGSMIGPMVGPVLGGVISYKLGWRWIFWILAFMAFPLWISQIFFLPETLRKLVGNGSGYANPTPIQYFKSRKNQERSTREKGKRVIPNPFQSLRFLKEKDVAVVTLYYSFQYAGLYCVLTSMTDLFTDNYGLNELQIGLCYLSHGLGSTIGAFTSGKILNWRFKKFTSKSIINVDEKAIKSEKVDVNFPIEKARMDQTWIWGLIFNLALIAYGWCLYYKAHLAIVLCVNFIMSFCSTSILNAIHTLLVDLFPKNSAAIMATNNMTRCVFSATAIMVVDTGINQIGVGWLFTTLSLILFVSRITMLFELRYGPKWRLERFERENKRLEKDILVDDNANKA